MMMDCIGNCLGQDYHSIISNNNIAITCNYSYTIKIVFKSRCLPMEAFVFTSTLEESLIFTGY